jgi:hypothetical protein
MLHIILISLSNLKDMKKTNYDFEDDDEVDDSPSVMNSQLL